MEYKGMRVNKRFQPLYQYGASVEAGEKHDTIEDAEREIQDTAERSFWAGEGRFDFARINVTYEREEIWEGDN